MDFKVIENIEEVLGSYGSEVLLVCGEGHTMALSESMVATNRRPIMMHSSSFNHLAVARLPRCTKIILYKVPQDTVTLAKARYAHEAVNVYHVPAQQMNE